MLTCKHPQIGTRRKRNIDGLRGLGASLVVMQHAAERLLDGQSGMYAQLLPFLLLHVVNVGFAGVVAFFGVSGFVVPYSLRGARPMRRFAISRVLRLYPAYWVSLACALIVFACLRQGRWPILAVLANTTMVPGLFRQQAVLGVYWTLPIELGFYCLSAAAFMLGLLRSARYLFGMIAALLLAGLAIGVAGLWRHQHYPVGYCLLIATMHLGTLVRRDAERSSLSRRAICAVAIAAAPIIWLAFVGTGHRSGPGAEIAGFYLGLGLFLLCVYRSMFGSLWLVALGGLSYSIYLFHPIVIEIARTARTAHVISAWEALIVTLLATCGLSWSVHRWIETPARKAAARIEALLGAPSRMAEART